MARDSIAFVNALGIEQVDILGFSIGSFVAQEIVLARPEIARRVVLASSAPQGAAGMHGWAKAVMDAVGTARHQRRGVPRRFFAPSAASHKAGQETLSRQYARTEDRDVPTDWATREAQYDAVCTWGIPDHATLQRVAAIKHPVFIANGDSDPMILPHYSYLMARRSHRPASRSTPTRRTASCSSTTPSSPPTSRRSSAKSSSHAAAGRRPGPRRPGLRPPIRLARPRRDARADPGRAGTADDNGDALLPGGQSGLDGWLEGVLAPLAEAGGGG